MTHLHVFDLDGTLLRDSTASIEIARHLGCQPQTMELESDFKCGLIDTREFAKRISALWAALTESDVDLIFDRSPWMLNTRRVFEDISRRGEKSCVITMSPDFFARRLLRFGVDAVRGSQFPPLPMNEPPDPNGILSPRDKVDITYEVLEHAQLQVHEFTAYGDSLSDIPLFQSASRSISVNGDETARSACTDAYAGNDLWKAYQQVRRAMCTIDGSRPTGDHRQISASDGASPQGG